jgi:hypothetical protein
MPSPQFLADQNKSLYLYDSTKGIYIFDYYGAFKKKISYTGWKDFTVINNLLFGRSDNQLFRYDPVTLELQEYAIASNMANAIKILIAPDNLYVLAFRSSRDLFVQTINFWVKQVWVTLRS